MISAWLKILLVYSNDRHILKEIPFNQWLESHSETRLSFFRSISWIVSINRDWGFEMSLLFYTIAYQVLFCFVKWWRLGVFLIGDCSNTLIRICLFHWSHPLQYHQCSLFASLRFSLIWNWITWKWLKMSKSSFV